MTFFNEEQQQTGAEYAAATGIESIPEGTNLKTLIDEAKWSIHEGNRYIEIRHTVLEPKTYENRKVFQKVRVLESDPVKADRAKRMLAAIDANCGGNIVKLNREPTEADLQTNLMNKIIMIKVGVWEIDSKSGNWVMAVMKPDNTQIGDAQQVLEDDSQIPF